jgi:hypothetical protein
LIYFKNKAQGMDELRLGDIIDDYCIKCRRMTNHAIVSIVEGQAAKVRCRSCYHDHTYLHEQIPPSKKDLKKAELLASNGEAPVAAESEEAGETEIAPDVTTPDPTTVAAAGEPKKARGRAKRA